MKHSIWQRHLTSLRHSKGHPCLQETGRTTRNKRDQVMLSCESSYIQHSCSCKLKITAIVPSTAWQAKALWQNTTNIDFLNSAHYLPINLEASVHYQLLFRDVSSVCKCNKLIFESMILWFIYSFLKDLALFWLWRIDTPHAAADRHIIVGSTLINSVIIYFSIQFSIQ